MKQPKDMRPYWPANMKGGFDPYEDGPYLREKIKMQNTKELKKELGIKGDDDIQVVLFKVVDYLQKQIDQIKTEIKKPKG